MSTFSVPLLYFDGELERAHQTSYGEGIRVSSIYDGPKTRYFDVWATAEGIRLTLQEDLTASQSELLSSWIRVGVGNLDASVSWYEQHMGMRLLDRDKDSHFVIMALKHRKLAGSRQEEWRAFIFTIWMAIDLISAACKPSNRRGGLQDGRDFVSVLFVSDLDGTLLNDKQEIDNESIEIINQLINKGMNFTVATARSIESVREIVKALQIKVPMILINGVFIFDAAKSRNIKENYLPTQLAARVLEAYLESGTNPLVYTTDSDGNSHIYYRGIFNKSEENYIGNRLSKRDRRFRIIKDYDECINENILTVNAIDKPQKLEKAFQIYVNNEECACHYGPDIYTPAFNWLEISSRYATKKEAVLYLKNKFNFEKVVCFGDNLNDLSMFEAADEKYAVSNAHETILNTADKIIESNNHNGVARFLKTVL